jgi:hypothetical protein
MKIKFQVQNGGNRETCELDVDMSLLSEHEVKLLWERLCGGEIFEMTTDHSKIHEQQPGGTMKITYMREGRERVYHIFLSNRRVIASAPTVEALLVAIKANRDDVDRQMVKRADP